MARLLLAAVAILVGFVFTRPRDALTQEPWRAGVSAGTTLGGVTEQGEAVWGAHVSRRLGTVFSVELAAFRFTDHPYEQRLGIRARAALPVTPVHLSVRATRPLGASRLEAWGLGGVGYYFWQDTDFQIDGLAPGGPLVQTGPLRVDKEDGYGWHAAAGVAWRLHRALSVFVEYRYARVQNEASISGLEATRPEGDVPIRAFAKDFWDNNEIGIARIGMELRFGAAGCGRRAPTWLRTDGRPTELPGPGGGGSQPPTGARGSGTPASRNAAARSTHVGHVPQAARPPR